MKPIEDTDHKLRITNHDFEDLDTIKHTQQDLSETEKVYLKENTEILNGMITLLDSAK